MPSPHRTRMPRYNRSRPKSVSRQIGGTIGAEVEGVKLSGELPRTTVTVIHQALVRHRVLFFRDQSLDDAGQEAFARLWGRRLVAHPTIPSLEGTEADSRSR